MIDLEQIVIRRWSKRKDVVKYFTDRGYIFTGYGDEFEVKVKDLPMNAADEVTVTCDCCGNEKKTRYQRYNETIEKHGNYYCNHCKQNRTLKKRQEEMYNKIIEYCNKNNYKLVTQKEEILSRQTYVTYICPEHGPYTTQVSNILQGKLCYKCSRHNAGINTWKNGLSDRIKNYYNIALNRCNELGYKLISKEDEILNYDTYIKYECPIHGEHEIKYGNFVSGKKCPDCSRSKSLKIKDTTIYDKVPSNKLNADEVIKRVEKCGGVIINPYDYINQNEKNLQILCPRCGNPFITSLNLFTQHGGQVCSDCYRKESVGERRIRQYLEKNNIQYIPEYWFNDCRDVNPLPFDFYLQDMNILIEFDGKQHFVNTKYFHNSYDFEKNKKHDNIKNDYCITNNIKLIRIPYWQIDKIEELLDNELNYSHEDIV